MSPPTRGSETTCERELTSSCRSTGWEATRRRSEVDRNTTSGNQGARSCRRPHAFSDNSRRNSPIFSSSRTPIRGFRHQVIAWGTSSTVQNRLVEACDNVSIKWTLLITNLTRTLPYLPFQASCHQDKAAREVRGREGFGLAPHAYGICMYNPDTSTEGTRQSQSLVLLLRQQSHSPVQVKKQRTLLAHA